MADPIKDFSALLTMRKELEQARIAAELAAALESKRRYKAELEADLFRRSIGQVALLPEMERVMQKGLRPEPVARHHLADERAALAESLSDEFNIETLLDTDSALSYARNGIGAETLRKLRRGHWVIQAQLDLHGLRTDEARSALAEFLRHAERRGLRCVRIIHGKGLGSINKEPVLKNKVRNWLVQKQEVLGFCQAKASDGGSGALVVLLRALSRP